MGGTSSVAARSMPFARYWCAATISSFGTAVTAVAMPVLVVRTLASTPVEVGMVNAAQFVPYALLGLIAGVYVDRWRRRTVLVWSSVGRALALGAIPVLWALGSLHVWMLVILLLAFGAFSVFGFAATQSLLPRLVPTSQLVIANARLDQTDTAAQTLGPVLGGGMVGVLGAPVTIAVDAVSYVVDAALNAGLRVEEPRSSTADRRDLLGEVREGVNWTYRHRTLGPLAVSTHVWFLANSASFTALAVIALRTLGFSSLSYSLLLTTSGLAGLVGATLAPKIGLRWGAGRTIICARAAYPVAWLVVALTLTTSAHTAALFVALAVHGLAAGVENANEMGYWQAATPDGLLGRVNATRRSANRTVAVLGSLLGGTVLATAGDRATILSVATVFGVAAAIAAFSQLRTNPETQTSAAAAHGPSPSP
ncbi:MFS transporter [Actinoallomurus iriomotensis]|nr:MFS transporter [Actinoallomurus iriomotensis]